MPLTLEILSATDTLAAHQTALRRVEKKGFVLLSFAVGRAEGRQANLVTFVQDQPAPAGDPLTLEPVAGSLDKDAQEAELNAAVGAPVCYGSLLVKGQVTNVLARR